MTTRIPAPGWPPGASEMARRIREHDWAATSLGPVAGWPPELRTLVDLMLASGTMMCLMWGRSGLVLYNDAYARGIGGRHPAALGRSVFEVWADVREAFEAHFERAWAGEEAAARDLPLRFGRPDVPHPEGWYDLTYTPVRDGDGQVAAILAHVVDVTERVQAIRSQRASEERQAFLLKLSDALRPLADPIEVQREACRVLGEHLGVGWVQYTEIDSERNVLTNVRDYYRGKGPSHVGDYDLSVFPVHAEAWRAGRSLVVGDVANDPRLGEGERASMVAASVRAALSTPLVKDERLVAVMSALDPAPREWEPQDVRLLEDTAERTWAAIERARAEAALRESEERLQVALAAADLGAWVWHVAEDRTEADARALAHFGLPPDSLVTLAEALVTTFHPEDGPRYAAAVARAMEPAGPGTLSMEFRIRRPDGQERWMSVSAITAFEGTPPAAARMTGVLADVTDRKRVEQALRESEERQAFLLRLSDALRPLADPVAIQEAAARTLGEHLSADRAYYVGLDEARQVATVEQEYRRGEAPSLVGDHAFAAYGATLALLRTGEAVVFGDVETEPEVSPADLPAYRALGLRAFLNTPLIKEGVLIGAMCVVSAEPRRWTDADVALVEEVGQRTWAAVERARAETLLRESEAKYRTLFETMGQGYAEIELLRDREGRAVDQRYLEFNPAFERLIGIPVAEARGRKASEVLPDLEPWWTETFDRIARRGEPERIEHEVASLGRWYEVYAYPRGGDRIIVLYEDATGRRQVEDALRESEGRQAFLLRLSDALRPLADPAEITEAATRLLGESLNTSRAYYAEWPADADYGEIARDWAVPGLPSLVGRYPIEAFRSAYDQVSQGRTWIVEDNASAPGISDAERQYHDKVGVIAWVDVPLTKEGRPVAVLCVVQDQPRQWTDVEVALIEETAERTWDAVERARAERALRESEARLVAAFESVPVGAAVIDASGTAVISNSGYRRFLPNGVIPSRDPARVGRWRAWDAEGQSLEPRDFPGARALRGERVMPGQEMIYTDDDGREIWTSVSAVPIRDAAGQVTGVATVITDIDATKRNLDALRASEEQLRSFGEASSDVLWIRDAETLDWIYLSSAFERIYGLGREEALHGDTMRNWLDMIVPEDRERARGEMEKARAGERVTFEYRIARPVDGEVRLLRNTDFPIRDAAGRITRLGGVGHDATDEQATAERLKVLVYELQHRTRNLMGVVRAVTDKTLAGSTSLEDFQGRIRDRLGALTRVNGLLSRLHEGDRITFDELLRSELRGHGVIDGNDHGSQVDLRGPKGIRLRSSTVQTLALGLHELATNALKYGALSQPSGRLGISWSLVPGPDGQRRLRVDWRESGVAVAVPDGAPAQDRDGAVIRRRGYGRELIERALPYQLKAETAYELAPDGVRCTITLPLSSTLGEGGSWREDMDA